jgi:ribonuclease HI
MTIVIYSDGGARGNPGNAGIGVAMYEVADSFNEINASFSSSGLELFHTISKSVGETTNNQAEWQGILTGLQYLIDQGKTEETVCFLDSELVVKQINGVYKVKHPDLKPHSKTIAGLKKQFKSIKFVHVLREKNKVADALANEAMDAASK